MLLERGDFLYFISHLLLSFYLHKKLCYNESYLSYKPIVIIFGRISSALHVVVYGLFVDYPIYTATCNNGSLHNLPGSTSYL